MFEAPPIYKVILANTPRFFYLDVECKLPERDPEFPLKFNRLLARVLDVFFGLTRARLALARSSRWKGSVYYHSRHVVIRETEALFANHASMRRWMKNANFLEIISTDERFFINGKPCIDPNVYGENQSWRLPLSTKWGEGLDSRLIPYGTEEFNLLAHLPDYVPDDSLAREVEIEEEIELEPEIFERVTPDLPENELSLINDDLFNQPMNYTRVSETTWRVSPVAQDIRFAVELALALPPTLSHVELASVLIQLARIGASDQQRLVVCQHHRRDDRAIDHTRRLRDTAKAAGGRIQATAIGHLINRVKAVGGGLELVNEARRRVSAWRSFFCPVHRAEEPFCQMSIEVDGDGTHWMRCFHSKPSQFAYMGRGESLLASTHFCSTEFVSDQLELQKALNDWMDAFRASGIPPRLTIVITARMGSGKSTFLQQFFRALPGHARGLIPTSRTQLATKFWKDFSEEFRGHMAHYHQDMSEATVKVVQLESIATACVENAQMDPRPLDFIILEELTSLFTHTTSSTLDLRRGLVLEIFEKLIRDAALVVVCDADYSHWTHDLLEVMRGLSEIQVHRNLYCGRIQRAFHVHTQPGTFYETLVNELKAHRRIYAAFNSKKEAKTCATLLPPGVRVKLYTGESSDKDRRELARCSEVWLDFDAVIATPVIECGTNFDPKTPEDESFSYFDTVFCWVARGSSLPNSCMQQIGRVRHPSTPDVHVYIDRGRKPKVLAEEPPLPTDPEAVRALLELHILSYRSDDTDNMVLSFLQPQLIDGRFEFHASEFVKRLAVYLRCLEFEKRNDVHAMFVREIKRSGGRIERYVKAAEADSPPDREHAASTVVYDCIAVNRAIALAEGITEARAKEIANQLNREDILVSEEDRLSFARYHTLSLLGFTESVTASGEFAHGLTPFFTLYADPSRFARWMLVVTGGGATPNPYIDYLRRRYIELQANPDLFFSEASSRQIEMAGEVALCAWGQTLKDMLLRPAPLTDGKAAFARLAAYFTIEANRQRAAILFGLTPRSSNAYNALLLRESGQKQGTVVRFISTLFEMLFGIDVYYVTKNRPPCLNEAVISSHLITLFNASPASYALAGAHPRDPFIYGENPPLRLPHSPEMRVPLDPRLLVPKSLR